MNGTNKYLRSVYWVWALCFLPCVHFLSCKTSTSKVAESKACLILKSDSGYVSKSEALGFLIANQLTDTTGDYWKIRFPKNGDTIGKYYPSNTRGNTILLVKAMDKNTTFETHMLLEINKDGQLISHSSYGVEDDRCEDAIMSFRKKGKYFIITGCGHGSGLGWEYGYVFPHAVQGGQLNAICFSSFCSISWANPEQAQKVSSTMEMDDTSLLFHYTIKAGWNNRSDEIQWQSVRKADVRYTWQTDHWVTKDSALLENVCLD